MSWISNHENKLISVDFLGIKISWIKLIRPRKQAEFSWHSAQENELINLIFQSRKLVEINWFSSQENKLNSWLEIQLFSTYFRGRKMNWNQLVYIARNSAYFSSFSWPEDYLIQPIFSHFHGWEINWIQLIFLAR